MDGKHGVQAFFFFGLLVTHFGFFVGQRLTRIGDERLKGVGLWRRIPHDLSSDMTPFHLHEQILQTCHVPKIRINPDWICVRHTNIIFRCHISLK